MKNSIVKAPRIRAPKDFYFKIIKNNVHKGCKYNNIYVRLYDRNARGKWHIGYIHLNYIGNKTYVTHSHLDSRYHNRGIGTKLYGKAIQYCLDNGFKVRSSGNSSDMAKRVWQSKSLRTYFNIRSNNKNYPFIWYANPKK